MATRVYKYGLVPIGYPPRDAERRVQENTKAIRLNAQFLALRKKNCFISFLSASIWTCKGVAFRRLL